MYDVLWGEERLVFPAGDRGGGEGNGQQRRDKKSEKDAAKDRVAESIHGGKKEPERHQIAQLLGIQSLALLPQVKVGHARWVEYERRGLRVKLIQGSRPARQIRQRMRGSEAKWSVDWMKKGSGAMMDKRQANQGEGVRTTSLPQAEEEKLWVLKHVEIVNFCPTYNKCLMTDVDYHVTRLNISAVHQEKHKVSTEHFAHGWRYANDKKISTANEEFVAQKGRKRLSKEFGKRTKVTKTHQLLGSSESPKCLKCILPPSKEERRHCSMASQNQVLLSELTLLPWLNTKVDQWTIPRALPFQPGPGRMAPAKKGGERKKGRSAINELVTREYTINVHKHIHGVGFKKHAPRTL
eukprot:bmy_16743T0